jgi:serine/threonine protein kinase
MTTDATAPAPSQLGVYDILSKIADGGMGTVYRAKNRNTGELVAVKVIAPATAKNPVLLQRFEREFAAAKVLDHPNVVKAIDYSGAMPHPFLVMEFVDGLSIGQRIEQRGAYPEAEALKLVAQVCDGLQCAHKQGLVHRDVKPDNILVTRSGVAKLTDMGLVKEVEGDLNLTKTGRGLGTPHYMAPEQFRNAKTVDVRGDIYSLGATLYAMVTGVVPFDNASPLDCWMKKIRNEFPSPKELNPAISDRVDWAIRRAMSAEPGQRPNSCREFLQDLTGQSTPAAAPAPAPAAAAADVWYLVYRDENNNPHTVKGSTDGIRKALRDRLLGDPSGVVVSRQKNGNFVPLNSTPEFRDLVVAPTPAAPARMDPEATADYGAGAPASGVRIGPRGGASSGARPGLPPPPPPAPAPAPAANPNKPAQSSSGTRPRVAAPASPQPESTLFQYGGGQQAANKAGGDSGYTRSRRNTNRTDEEEVAKMFNWTPVLVITVVVLLLVVGWLALRN